MKLVYFMSFVLCFGIAACKPKKPSEIRLSENDEIVLIDKFGNRILVWQKSNLCEVVLGEKPVSVGVKLADGGISEINAINPITKRVSRDMDADGFFEVYVDGFTKKKYMISVPIGKK